MNIVIIQAHMASTRLPDKIMKKLCGIEVLLHDYNRCARAENIDKVIVATSTNPENDRIEELCYSNNIPCFRGSESDVLDRYYKCALQYNPDIVVRVTSDCPLVEPKMIDYFVRCIESDRVEFVDEEKGLFLGHGLDIFSWAALNKMKEKAYTDKQKEHVVGYFLDHKEEFSSKMYPLPEELSYAYRPYRLTLDTKEDFELMTHLYNKFYINGWVDLKAVMEYIDENKSILDINKIVEQKKY